MDTISELGSVANSVDEKLPHGLTKNQLAASISPYAQELILLPTEKCNLRCTYCYEDFAIGKMSETTQRAIELFIIRRSTQLKSLKFNWFGGEPLVAKDVVLRLSRFAQKICSENDIVFEGGLTTNGLLLGRKLFEDLLDCNQNFFQITLDGWGADHDLVRKFANGKGSFDGIWKNLIALKSVDREFEILLRIHVRRENIETLATLLKNVAVQFGNDRRFRLDFEHVRNLGGVGGVTVKEPVGLSELRSIEQDLRKIYTENLPSSPSGHSKWAVDTVVVQHVEAALEAAKAKGESAGSQRASDIAAGGPYICYAAKANSLLIRANGRIGKCTVAFNDERNDIGQLNPDGSISVDNTKLRPWLRGLGDLDIESLGCPLHRMPLIALSQDFV